MKALMGYVLVVAAGLLCATSLAAPRIAILDEPGLPYYMAPSSEGPRFYQDLYQAMGLQVDMLSAKQLADPAVFNARRYAAYVHPYGNTFPLVAFANLVRYHEDGGVLIIPSGVPFCHPCAQTGAADWQLNSPKGGARVTGGAHSGQAYFRVSTGPTDQWMGPNGPRLKVKPGEKYTIGGWVRVPKAMAFQPNSCIFLRFWDANSKFLGQEGPSLPTQPCDWTRIEKEVVVPQGAVAADVSVQLWAPGSEVDFDDLFLTRAGEAKNLVEDPGFEVAAGQWADLGHNQKYMTHDQGIGIGEFTGADKPGRLEVTDFGRKIGLDLADWSKVPAPAMVQTLDPKSLPPEDEVRPIVTAGEASKGLSPAVMILHHCRKFNGAIDVWGRGNCGPLQGIPLYEVVMKATVAALRLKGDITSAEAQTMIAKADDLLKQGQQTFVPVTEKCPYDSVWPHSKHPAATIDVCDVSKTPPAEQFRMAVLEGLVNRVQPRLYLIHANYPKQDKQWLDELKYEGLKTEDVSPAEAWRQFGNVAKGVVVYDRAALKEIGAFHANRLNITNIVLMLCAVNDAVPMALDAGEAVPAGEKVVMDTRGKWATPYDMYKWAYDTLWPKMNHWCLATLYPGIYYLTDYLVENRIFTFWFGSQRTFREQTLLNKVLASTPPNTPILGWWFDWMPNVQDPAHASADCVGEGEGVRLGSEFAHFLTVTHEATNLSVHSGMPLLPIKRKQPANPPKLDRSKVYFSFLISDGDNLGECLMMRCRELQWDTPDRGTEPMGWSFAPATAVLAPPVLNYYLRTATANDQLVGGLGIGYTSPDVYASAYPKQRDAIFKQYARMSADSLKPLHTGALWLIGGSKASISKYAAAGAPLTTLFPDYGWGVKRPYDQVTYMDVNHVAVFRAVTGWGSDQDYVTRLVHDIRASTEGVRPAFVHAFLLNWSFRLPMMKKVIDQLGPDYVPVTPDELDRLYRESLK